MLYLRPQIFKHMKRVIIAVIAAMAAVMSVSSCGEIVTLTYWVQVDEASDNYNTNLYLQTKVSKEIDIANGQNTFFGSEEDAINWFNGKMDYLGSKEFADSDPVPVLDGTTATFSLRTTHGAADNSAVSTDSETVTTRTVTFQSSSSL